MGFFFFLPKTCLEYLLTEMICQDPPSDQSKRNPTFWISELKQRFILDFE